MEVRVLRYFLTVAREENITKAAELLHITQPTLSRQLAQLEEDLGVKLFERGTRRITLTNEGVLLRRRAEEITELIDKTEHELVSQEEMVEGTVEFGCGILSSVYLLADLIEAFSRRYPLVRYKLYTETADRIKARMDRGLTDVGLLLEPVNVEKYEFIRLGVKEVWGVMMRADDPMAALKRITPGALAGKRLILPYRENVQSELLNWLGEFYDEKDGVFTSNMAPNAAIMVEKGLGYAITIRGSLTNLLDESRLCFRPLEPDYSVTSVLAWKRSQPFSPAVMKFIDFAKCFLSMDKR